MITFKKKINDVLFSFLLAVIMLIAPNLILVQSSDPADISNYGKWYLSTLSGFVVKAKSYISSRRLRQVKMSMYLNKVNLTRYNKLVIKMKALNILITCLTLCLFTLSSSVAQSENKIEYSIIGGSALTLSGTSTMHSYHLDTKNIQGNLFFTNSDSGESIENLGSISSMKVVIPVKDLKSSESGLEEKMDDAIKANANPNIVYVLNKIDSFVYNNGSKTDFTINTSGTLTVAGKSKDIEMKVNGKIKGDDITFTGDKKLLMTDFGIEPVTMFFGVLKTGNEVTIHFNIVTAKK
jgi:YceI-like domain